MKQWRNSKRRHAFACIDPSLSSTKFEKLIANLPCHHASLLILLRTGHVLLNAHLHRIKHSPMKLCPACKSHIESVQHFLLSCPFYHPHCYVLTQELSCTATLLSKLLSSPRATRPLFRYIHTTSRFTTV
ncbi:hypothetical protein BKA93DRAFT_738260 [Sparassis latifolia]